MWKIFLSFIICLFLFTPCSEGSQPSFVSLWKSDNMVIQGILPRDWRPLNTEEFDTLQSVVPGNITKQSGKIVSGYKFQSDSEKGDKTLYPQIIVFVKTDEYVNQEMIQKTYLWLQKNKNPATNKLSDNTSNLGIHDIKNNKKLPAIIFQNKIPVKGHHFTGLSSIIFLKNNILNIVCLAEEKEFAEYETVFHSFIESIFIPQPLRHDAVINDQSTTLFNNFLNLVKMKWQPLLGVFIIITIYGWVFGIGREKSIQF